MTGPTGEPGRGPAAPAELTYAEATAELDAIIAEFDEGQVDVDRLAERFQRATELVEELDRRIRANRQKVESLAPRLDAVVARPQAPAAAGATQGEGGGEIEDDDGEPSLL